MEIREESGLRFRFPDDSKIIKFDDTVFYRKFFNALPDSKGVDFIATEKDSLSFIEVKNCTGDEGRSMNVKMRWLNCKVSVVDSSTYDEKIFRIV